MRWFAVLLMASMAMASEIEDGRRRFNVRCAGCHGEDGLGGERAPGLGRGSRKRLATDAAVRGIIAHGIPDTGMPAFDVPAVEMGQLSAFVRSRATPLSASVVVGDADSGERFFFGKGACSECHMIHGRGGWKGPDLTESSRNLTLGEIETSLRHPNARRVPGYQVASVTLASGEVVRGFIRNESGFDLQLLGLDGKLRLLLQAEYKAIAREADSLMPPFTASADEKSGLIAFLRDAPERKLSQRLAALSRDAFTKSDWPTYHGQQNGNRYSGLAEINLETVRNLSPAWQYPMGSGQALQTTPVVADGVMYVTGVNALAALDARTGRKIWSYSRPRSEGLVGDAAGGINRGVALRGDRVFMVTDNAHLIALHRVTGGLIWDTEMADSKQHYGATSAPLVVGDLVVSGISGGDEGVRGFVSAYSAGTGERVWTFKTIPDRGDPEASTWVGRALEHGCGSTWLTGTYDAAADTVFWPVGNPCPDFNGDERKGDNLYTDSVLALDPKTGKRKWHYQFTPHDLHDWDATETPMLVDADYHGTKRQLLLQGNRNGFFYVLDRAQGKFLRATPFVNKLNWASRIGESGRPVLTEAFAPTEKGTEICPSMDGATNWMSTAFHPETGLFYLVALEKCNVFSKNAEWWKQGESFYGGAARVVDQERPRKFVRAINLQSGAIAWEREQSGPGETWGGLLATAGGLLFSCEESGALVALNAATGSPVWHFQMNAAWHASPMTYEVAGKQYVAMAAGPNIVAFALSAEARDVTLSTLLNLLHREWQAEPAMQTMRQVYSTDRYFTFPKFAETARYLEAGMERIGLKQVEVINAPADGKTQVGYWTEPLAWDAKSATLELLDDAFPLEQRMLADYRKVPASLGMWSGPTPKEGVVAEIVEVSVKDIGKTDLRGKLVLTDVNPANIKHLLVKAGALGAINTFTENPSLAEGRQWINAWGDDGWAYTARSTPMLCFSITPNQARMVRGLLRKGPVRARAIVDTRFYQGAYPYVTGVIPGTTNEEVLTLGHMAEQGAEDNATGVAATMEAMATLQRLIAQGKLPPPRRSIRILSMGEMYGSMHYVEHNRERIQRTVAAMCVDTPAASYELPGTEYTFYMNPHVAKDFTDSFILKVAVEYLASVGRPWHEKEFTTGTDTYMAEPMVGVPTVWGYSGSGVETHHNSEDTPDRVDARSLRDISIIDAAFLYYIANAGEQEALSLAKLAETRGYEQVKKRSAPDEVEYAVDREAQAIRSVARLVPQSRREAVVPTLTAAVDRLKVFGAQQGAAKGQPGTEGSTIVVKRKRFGTLPLDDLPHEQWEGYPSGAWAAIPTIALYWCDGHRNLAEVIRLTRLELGPTDFDFVGYFKFLERHGYVEFAKSL